MGMPFRAPKLRFLSEDRRVDALLKALGDRAARAPAAGYRGPHLLPQLMALAVDGPEALAGIEAQTPERPAPSRAQPDSQERGDDQPLNLDIASLLAALVAWAAPYTSLDELASAISRHRDLVKRLRRDDAELTLATAHSTKGLEFDHVAVIGMDAGRFPSGRSLRDAAEPDRTLEEERRLAYVAWTRARRTLTLVYDPAAPSPFMFEAFSPAELGPA
jgi:hypothetical protein